ncbi:MAG: hypothetical protein WC659_06640 [Patescibacteria group bacterium]
MPKNRNKYNGMFIMLDGLDGSGKSTIVGGIADYFKKNNLKIFDLKKYWKKHKTYPELHEVLEADVILSAEPSSVWAGEAIRRELIHDHSAEKYSARLTAQAFSIDRAILYRRVIIPALKVGKIVVQDRGVTTSLIYQPVQNGKMPLGELLRLEGNSLALHWAPDILLVADITPQRAMERLALRAEKKDQAIFERLSFQKKIYKRFKSGWFKSLMSRYGSKVLYLDASLPPQQMIKGAVEILKQYVYK